MLPRPTVPPKESPPGRSVELALLRDRVQAVKNGAKRAVFLTGPAGIGKTTLLEYVRDEISHEMRTAWIRVPGAGRLSPLFPLPQMLSQLGSKMDEERIAYPLYVADELSRLAQELPLALLIDDYAALPGDTSDILHAALKLATKRVLLVGTSRLEPGMALDRPLLPSSGDLVVDYVSLAPLDMEAVRQLASDLLQAPAMPSLVTRLHEQSGGNPLYASELIRSWRETTDLAGQERYWPDPTTTNSIPPSLQQLIGARIADLSTSASTVLAILALFATPLSHEELVDILPEIPSLVRVLDELVTHGLITQDTKYFRPSHSLFSSHVVHQLTTTRRSELHQYIFEYLSAVPSRHRTRSRLAHHALEGLVPLRQLSSLLKQAADEAESLADYRAATKWYALLLETADPTEDCDRFATLKQYAAVCLRVDMNLAANIYRQALEQDGEDPELWLGFARACRLQGNLEAALEAVNRSIRIWPSLDARYLLATLHGISGDISQAQIGLEELLRLVPDHAGDNSVCTRSSILLNLGMSAYGQGGLTRATKLTLESVECAVPGEQAGALQNAAWFSAITGNWAEARALTVQGAEAARSEGDLIGLSYLLAIAAKLDAWMGDADWAVDNALQAIRVARTAGLRANEIDGLLALGVVQLEFGSTSEALAALRSATELATSTHEVNEPALLQSALTEASAFEGIPLVNMSFEWRAQSTRLAVWSTAVERSRMLEKIAERELDDAYSIARSWDGNDSLPYEAAKFLLVGSRIAGHQRNKKIAKDMEERASAILASLGRQSVPTIVHLAEDLLRSGRGRPPQRNPAGLTNREIEVGQLAMTGLTDKEIAGSLTLSARTVSKYMENVLSKTGCKRRTQLPHFFQIYYSESTAKLNT